MPEIPLRPRWSRRIAYFAFVGTLVWFATAPNTRAQGSAGSASASVPAQQAASSGPSAIPPGTILPVILRTTMSWDKLKSGQVVHGAIAQDVPLPGGATIHAGSKVEGSVIGVEPGANGAATKVSIRFDKLYNRGQVIPVTTDLRAIAGFMDVMEAQIPDQSVGEGDVYDWMDTTQIGGDSVYGRGGPVNSAHNADEQVGKSLMNGGVLVRVTANSSGRCRGPLDGNDYPQPLWVFSSDACGTYGLTNLSINHAGRTDPVGVITLESDNPKLKLHSGDGLLLRVIG